MFKKSSFIVILLIVASTHIALGGILDKVFGKGEKKPGFTSDVKGRLLTPQEGCGQSYFKNNRIVGGGAVTNGAFPWMALLGIKNGNDIRFMCGGSVISTKHVLSAAHCFVFQPEPINFVRFGEHDTRNTKHGEHFDVGIAHVDNHEWYNRFFGTYDIALIHLEKHIKFEDRVRPICLPISETMRKMNHVGSNPFVAGWGNLKEKHRSANILQQVQVPVIEMEDCKQKYIKADKVNEVQPEMRFDKRLVMCAGFDEGGKDSCQGDSGGPLMLPLQYDDKHFAFHQIGVVAYGIGCARKNVPGIYTNVPHFMDWIIEKMRSSGTGDVDYYDE